jgi:hypothetical protein
MTDDVRALAKKLRAIAGPEFSEATAAALTRVAHAAHSQSLSNIRRDFTLRNKFTLGSMIFYKASPKKDPEKIDAITGSKSPYLPEQDEGGEALTRAGKPALSMPSLASRRGSWQRPVTARYRLGQLGTVGRRRNGKMTPNGAKFFWLSGGSLTKPTLFTRQGKKLVKVRLKTRPIHLKATHWHSSAVAKFGRPEVMSAAWGKELSVRLAKLGAR